MTNFTQNLDNNTEQTPNQPDKVNSPSIQKQTIQETKVAETLIVLKSGDIDITLPKNNSNIQIIKNILDGMKENQSDKE